METNPPIPFPADEHDHELAANTHPQDWRNPRPRGRYNLVVIGGGTAGLVTAAGAAGLGAKVALVERYLLGGDCLNYGCIPSKAVIRCARSAADVRDAGRFGIQLNGSVQVDFPKLMARMRQIRARISHHDSAERFRDLGVDVFLGAARFREPGKVEVGNDVLDYKRAVIATGARPRIPSIPGLSEAGFLTNETVFSLTELPSRLIVIGGGPIGCELAQCFARFGSQVTLIHNKAHLLDREDAEAAEVVQRRMVREGVNLHLGARIPRVELSGKDKIVVVASGEKEAKVAADAILVASGRQPNLESLGLEKVGVHYDVQEGVRVNDVLQTTQPRIYACGDICSAFKFTHSADAMARIVIQNALFHGRKKVSALTMPWCTFTDPEVAHVGLSEAESERRGIPLSRFTREFKDVDRARLDGEEDGFVKILVRKGGDQIVGATIVARHAGEMISEVSLAMAAKVGLGRLANVIHPYPTQAEAIKQCADAYNRTRLTPGIKRLFQKWLAWTR